MVITPFDEVRKPTLSAFEVITTLVREVFGTYFIEEEKWNFPDASQVIGRTYFADRKKLKYAINEKTVDNLILIYELVFDGQSTYNAMRISENLVRVLKEQYNVDFSYAMFFNDDTENLRSMKILTLRSVVREIAEYAKNKTHINPNLIDDITSFVSMKTRSFIAHCCKGTYTETVLRAIEIHKFGEYRSFYD